MPTPHRRTLVATLLLSTALAVPVGVGTAAPASAVPCPLAPLPCVVPPTATTAPAISGTATVGETLFASAPVWDQDDVTTTYQWNRDGAAISGATAQTYPLVGQDFGAEVTVTATGTNAALVPGTSESAAVEPAKGPAITPLAPPSVTGANTIGGTLTTTAGSWGEPEPSFTYQWYRSKPAGSGYSAIADAAGTTYEPGPLDAGRRLAVLVTAERFGYEPGVAVSNLTVIPKANAFPVLTLARKKITAAERGRARIVVIGLDGGLAPTGLLEVTEGRRVLGAARLAAPAGGRATVTLPRLAVGRHTLAVRYLGDTTYRGVTSSSAVLTVTR